MNLPETKRTLGVPHELNFSSVNMDVHHEFWVEGDMSVFVPQLRLFSLAFVTVPCVNSLIFPFGCG